MIKVFGFSNGKDFLTSIITVKYNLLLTFAGLYGASLGPTFEAHFWKDSNQILFLLILLFFDLVTGIWYAIKAREFVSKKLPRWCGIVFAYCITLFLAHNLSIYSPVFSFLPASLYAIYCATVFVSLFENLNKLGYINIKILDWLRSKIDFDTITKSADKKENKELDNKSIEKSEK